jgi:hypothetical protein
MQSTKAPVVVVSGSQRSGTTVFSEILGFQPGLFNCGEVFHPEGIVESERSNQLRLKTDYNYFNYISKFAPDRNVQPMISGPESYRIWTDYIAYISLLEFKKVPILSIKHNSWHHLHEAWQDLAAPPQLVKIALRQRYALIRITRRNVLHQVISEILAAKTGVWHLEPGKGSYVEAKMSLDTEFVIKRVVHVVMQNQCFSRWTASGYCLDIEYEQLFDQEGSPNRATWLNVFDFLLIDAEPTLDFIPLEKVNKFSDYSWILNFEDLERKLRLNQLEHFIT